jgi:tRNA threonylcarbamoyladenosine biosynthesis protein TsaB
MTSRTDPAGKARPGTAQGFAEGKSRPILAIETGSRSCSVAIFVSPADVPAVEHENTDHGHATMLMPMIERAMGKADCDYADLGRIAVSVGPGSFTGIRVGLAAALGLSLASGVPVVGISSFLTVADVETRERQDRRLFALLDSRREEPFLVELDTELRFLQPPAVVTPQALDEILARARPLILAGDAPAMGRYATQGGIRLMQTAPHAMAVALLAADPGRRFDLPPKPVYVRPPDVTIPKRK